MRTLSFLQNPSDPPLVTYAGQPLILKVSQSYGELTGVDGYTDAPYKATTEPERHTWMS